MHVCVRAEASVGRDGGNWNLCAPWAGLQHRMAAAENSLLLLKKLDIELRMTRNPLPNDARSNGTQGHAQGLAHTCSRQRVS